MDHLVFVARPGFETAPIHQAEWLAAARDQPLLQVRENLPGSNRPVGTEVVLAADPRQSLRLNATGQLMAELPGRALAQALFAVAPALQAQVYNGRREPYASLDDWDHRTRHLRRRSASRSGSHDTHPPGDATAADRSPHGSAHRRRRRHHRHGDSMIQRPLWPALLWIGAVTTALLLGLQLGLGN